MEGVFCAQVNRSLMPAFAPSDQSSNLARQNTTFPGSFAHKRLSHAAQLSDTRTLFFARVEALCVPRSKIDLP